MLLGFLTDLLKKTVGRVDSALEKTPAHQIIIATAALYFIYNQYKNPWLGRMYRSIHNETLKQRVIDAAYETVKFLPQVKVYRDQELEKNLATTREKLALQRSVMNLRLTMPGNGLSVDEILNEFGINIDDCAFDFSAIEQNHSAKEFVVQQGDGQDSGALYTTHPKELVEMLKEVYGATELTNPMHEKWPRINAMQAEVISWCQDLFHGSREEGYGLLTHGGTTSIIEAMAAYVIRARARGIAYPEIVVPETAHAAFRKAAELTGATLIIVPVDQNSGAVKAKNMASYISRNTAVIVGSAPSFMNGICDPIEDLGKLAQQYQVPLHVDACLGGFLTAFLDTSMAPMDFRVLGVTSLSADLHKYGYCPKGTSVCLFSKDSPALSVFAALNWPGGLYATPGILDGSTSGARVAEVYATMAYYGKNKYQEIAENIIKLRGTIEAHLIELVTKGSEISVDDISVYGGPRCSVLGFSSKALNPHLVAEELDSRGWKLNLLQNPAGFHLCLTHVHTLVPDFAGQFIRDLDSAIRVVKGFPKDKKPSGQVKVYGAVGLMPTEIQSDVCIQYQKARLQLKPSQQGLFSDKSSLSDGEVDEVVEELDDETALRQRMTGTL
jgi:glutamate/tyrosine decarboxylase-like PLP-dependent enzyme